MRKLGLLFSIIVGLGCVTIASAQSYSNATTISYHGYLERNGVPVNDTCNFRFSLYDAPTGGSLAGIIQSENQVTVTKGVFTALLTYNSTAFSRGDTYLEVVVNCGDGEQTLAPRQPIYPAPLAMGLPSLRVELDSGQSIEQSPNIIGGHQNNTVVSNVVGATISGGGMENRGNRVGGDFGTVSGGEANSANGDGSTIGGGVSSIADGANSTIAGGIGNTAERGDSTVGGGIFNRASGLGSTVAGGSQNTAASQFSTVSGGQNNKAHNVHDVVAGGFSNTAEGGTSIVGGGQGNTASGGWSTVGGGGSSFIGLGNTASGDFSTISGGANNIADGYASTVPGGASNRAGGSSSFAAGQDAKLASSANNTFLWSDGSLSGTLAGSNVFYVVSTGGVRLYTSGNLTNGARLDPGGGGWSTFSDHNLKDNIEPVDPHTVLESVSEMPISTWNYTGYDDITHMGPMAQDFHAAFGLGDDEKFIDTVDIDGVALASIQALYERVEEQDTRIAALERQLLLKESGMNIMAFVLVALGGYWFARRREGTKHVY